MKDKVVVVTGASSGIGKALAFEFGNNGAKLFITGRNREALEKTVLELESKQITVRSSVADSSIEQDNKRMIDECLAHYGTVHVLINNAGISMRALFEDVSLDVFRKVMETNFYGTVYATKFALPHILKNRGSIIGISSISGRRAMPGRSAYSASKHAMEGFLEALRTEVMKRGVHVMSVCPGFTGTNIRSSAFIENGEQQKKSPLDESKLMTPEEVAREVYSATVDRKRDLLLTKQGKLAVFLNKWIPGTMDKLVWDFVSKEPDFPMNKKLG
jgi:dehydrogenase/reductase SDR family member 7B